jgi:ADP-glucose pyrophosphorylase
MQSAFRKSAWASAGSKPPYEPYTREIWPGVRSNLLIDCLKNDEDDFGKNIILSSLQSHKVIAYIFQGYWEDIGTVRAFFEANLALTETVPPYNFLTDHLQFTLVPDFFRPVKSTPRRSGVRSSVTGASFPTRILRGR